MAFLPHRCNDDQQNEITRALILYGKSAEFVSFKLPKRYGNMEELQIYENQQVEYQEWEQGLIPKDDVYAEYAKQREVLEAKFEGETKTKTTVTPKGSRSFMANQFGTRNQNLEGNRSQTNLKVTGL